MKLFEIFNWKKSISKPDPNSTESAQEYNRKLDAYLFATGIVDLELYKGLQGAYGYGAVSTIGWLNAKLSVLRSRLNQGKSLYLYDTDSKSQIEICHTREFNNWIKLRFPDI